MIYSRLIKHVVTHLFRSKILDSLWTVLAEVLQIQERLSPWLLRFDENFSSVQFHVQAKIIVEETWRTLWKITSHVAYDQFQLHSLNSGLCISFVICLRITILPTYIKHNLMGSSFQLYYTFLEATRVRPQTSKLQIFQGSKLLNGCLGVWPNKQILSLFQGFFSVRH